MKRVKRRHDMTNNKTMTKTKTNNKDKEYDKYNDKIIYRTPSTSDPENLALSKLLQKLRKIVITLSVTLQLGVFSSLYL